jgi:hypothetical protein
MSGPNRQTGSTRAGRVACTAADPPGVLLDAQADFSELVFTDALVTRDTN